MFVTTDTLRDDLLAVNDAATALCTGLTPEELAWRPQPAKWSIAENLVHLRTTTELFLPSVDRAILETRRRGYRRAEGARFSWYGRLLVWYVEPPPVLRLPAPKALRPPPGPVEDALKGFLVSQNDMLHRIDEAADLSLTSLRFPSPLASFVRMNLLEFFAVFNGHSRRHLWQAGNVRRASPGSTSLAAEDAEIAENTRK